MKQDWESPTLLFRLMDAWGSNWLFSPAYRRYIKSLGLTGRENLIDFGSGSGAGSRHLAEVLQAGGGHLTCVDTSRYWMAKARRRMARYRNVLYLNAPITRLDLSEESFDGVYVHFALHEVTPLERAAVVRAFYRLIKPGGRVFIAEPQRKRDGMPIEEIRSLMADGGFREVSARKKGRMFTAVYIK